MFGLLGFFLQVNYPLIFEAMAAITLICLGIYGREIMKDLFARGN